MRFINSQKGLKNLQKSYKYFYFSTNGQIANQSVALLSYLPYHLSKENFRKLFIHQDQNIYQKIFEKFFIFI